MSNSISRLEKLKNLANPYPRDFPNRKPIKNILTEFQVATGLKEIDKLSNKIYKIAGRLESRRDHGSNIFFTIFDQTGSIQLHTKKPINIPHGHSNREETVWGSALEGDVGDMVGIEGTLNQNPRGEPLLLISNFTLLAKALKDPPANFHGLKNPEMKYRHRELDLLSSAESREVFKKRAEIVFEIRKYLNERDFVEIETPILQPIYGGATAKPFTTKHNALGQEFFLSISSELYLKRAMVGGYDRVYSFSRCFRNEGISPQHNPEFTNLEIFETCKTSDDMQIFTEDILKHIFSFIGTAPPLPSEFRYDFLSSDWPLSNKLSDNNLIADAWELYIDGMEIASGASDLNDPREQESRLKEKKIISSKDLNESYNPNDISYEKYNPYDKNYIEALEMGALPWAGVGIGIDRLCMLLLGKNNIRDVVIFPLLKNEK